MNEKKETTELKTKKNQASGETTDPVCTVREGAIAASIWLRQSPSGFPYYDFSLSRSWKNMSSGKTGYSKNFFDRNQDDLLRVIERASAWIKEQQVDAPTAENEATRNAA
jgi:hypothetical protein